MSWHSCTAFSRLMLLGSQPGWAVGVEVEVVAATATLATPRPSTRLACAIVPMPPLHRSTWPRLPPPSSAFSRHLHPPFSRHMAVPARPLSTCATCRAGTRRRCPTRTARRVIEPLSLKLRLPVRQKQSRRLRSAARRPKRLLPPHPPAHCPCANASMRPRNDVCWANNRQRAVQFRLRLPLRHRRCRCHLTQLHPYPLVLPLLLPPHPRATSPLRQPRRPLRPSPPLHPPRPPFRPPSPRRRCCRRPRQMQTWPDSCRRRKCWRQQKNSRGEMERVRLDDSSQRCNTMPRAHSKLLSLLHCARAIYPLSFITLLHTCIQ